MTAILVAVKKSLIISSVMVIVALVYVQMKYGAIIPNLILKGSLGKSSYKLSCRSVIETTLFVEFIDIKGRKFQLSDSDASGQIYAGYLNAGELFAYYSHNRLLVVYDLTNDRYHIYDGYFRAMSPITIDHITLNDSLKFTTKLIDRNFIDVEKAVEHSTISLETVLFRQGI